LLGWEEEFQSLPFGDGFNKYQSSLPTADDATEHHFTSKERDTESGNDYFDARYYSSTVGRFMSPDWSVKVEPVPYSKLDDPQTLNLYAYVTNNPLSRTDPTGHAPPCAWSSFNNCREAFDQFWKLTHCWCSAPTLPNGDAAPPPVPVPGHPELKWEYYPNGQNSRTGTWGPKKGTWKGAKWGSPPSASWDDVAGSKGESHWDVKDGTGAPTKHYDKDGNLIIPDDQANAKTPMQSLEDKINDFRDKLGQWEIDQWKGIVNGISQMPGGSNYKPSTTPIVNPYLPAEDW
jgi:RHS repeat-associated protein